IHWPELRSVVFTAAAEHNLLYLAGDATASRKQDREGRIGLADLSRVMHSGNVVTSGDSACGLSHGGRTDRCAIREIRRNWRVGGSAQTLRGGTAEGDPVEA